MNFYLINLLVSILTLENVHGWRIFWKGRLDGGNLANPHVNLRREQLPPDQWFDQKLDHFDDSNTELWKQVNA